MNRWYEIRNVAADSAEVFIYDEIGGWGVDASSFIAEIKRLAGKSLTVRIHSPGGSVLDGHAIFNALLRHDGGVTVQIDGLAASMAGVIAMAGKPVRMAENAFLMIHNPSGGAYGGSEDMRKAADLIDKMRDGLVNIFAKRTGKPAAEIETVMDAETWFTAAEAKAFGLVDEITDSLEMAAKFDVKSFRNAPRKLQAAASVVCEKCGSGFDYAAQPEVSMGTVACPNCKAHLNQEGKPVDTSRRDMAATIDSISAELTTAREALALAQGQAQKNFADYQAQGALVTALTTERDGFKAKLETAGTQISALTEDKTNLTNQLAEAQKISVEKINTEANRILAAHGHKPITLGADGGVGENTMTRSEFAKLSATAKSEFCRNKGRITED